MSDSRERWSRFLLDKRCKCNRISYDHLLDLFSPPALPNRRIAKILGVHASRIGQLKAKFFAEELKELESDTSSPAYLQRAYARAPVRKRNSMPYDKLFELFAEPGFHLDTIAEMLGVNIKMASRIYYQYFAPVLEEHRRNRVHQRSLRERTERRFRFKDSELMVKLERRIRARGLYVERIPSNAQGWQMNKRVLIIDGHRCYVHHMRRINRADSRRKGDQRFVVIRILRTSLPLWDARLVVLDLQKPKKMFKVLIIPTYVVAKADGGRRHADIVLQVAGLQYEQHHQPVDWFKYENAWHLLEGE